MRRFNFGTWVTEHRAWAHLILPAAVSLLMMGLYFSGSEILQQIVAPTVEGLAPFSWREFGALEMLQNVLLVCIIVLLLRSMVLAGFSWPGMLFAVLTLLFLFVFLEEIDYGMHFIEYLKGTSNLPPPQEWNRNLHNRSTVDGVQYGSYLKSAATGTLVVVFIISPFLLHNSRSRIIRQFTPSRWAALTVVLMVVLSRVAHLLDDTGLSHINGSPGNLEYNISEFRELNIYYIFLLYFAELNCRLGKKDEGRDPAENLI